MVIYYHALSLKIKIWTISYRKLENLDKKNE